MKDSTERNMLLARIASGSATWRDVFRTPLRYFGEADAPFPYQIMSSSLRERHAYGYWTRSELELSHPRADEVTVILDDSPFPCDFDLSQANYPRLREVNLWRGLAGEGTNLPSLRYVTASSFTVSDDARLPVLESVNCIVLRFQEVLEDPLLLRFIRGSVHISGQPMSFPMLGHICGSLDTDEDVHAPILGCVEGRLSIHGVSFSSESMISVGSLLLDGGCLSAPSLDEVKDGITADLSHTDHIIMARSIGGEVRLYKDASRRAGTLNLISAEKCPRITIAEGCQNGCFLNVPLDGIHYIEQHPPMQPKEERRNRKRARIGVANGPAPQTRPVYASSISGRTMRFYDPDRERFCPSKSGIGRR